MTTRCLTEVRQLHAFFEGCFLGSEPDLSRCSDVLADGFRIVSPGGVLSERAEVLEGLARARGLHRGEDFGIEVRNAEARSLGGGLFLVTYEEWQRQAGVERGRLSSALLREREGLPSGLEWVHVHETWLAP